MRQTWHIFTKDIRRFWPQIVATLVLLTWFANQDRWRSDPVPSTAEGWLNLLLPFAWAYLIGLVIIEDPLAGDRQFWLALPCGWRSLLASKALFVLIVIHIPYFVADAYILAARGFQPLQFLPQLLWKELILLVAITLPAAAVATLVRNVAQFVLAALVLGAGLVLLNAYVEQFSQPLAWYLGSASGNRLLALLVVAVGALAVAALQYSLRFTKRAICLGVAAALCASLVYAELPRDAAAAIDCALSPAKVAGQPIVRVAVGTSPNYAYYGSLEGAVSIMAPIEFTGLPNDAVSRIRLMTLAIDDPAGAHYSAAAGPIFSMQSRRPRAQAFIPPIDGHVSEEVRSSLQLTIDRALYNRLQTVATIVKSTFRIDYSRRGEPVTMTVGARADVSTREKCSSMIQPAEFGISLKVDCESPEGIPPRTLVTAAAPPLDQEWRAIFNDQGSSLTHPSGTWLSPLNHRDAFFSVVPMDSPRLQLESKYRIPEAALPTVQIGVPPESPAGSALIRLELPLAQLKQYEVQRR